MGDISPELRICSVVCNPVTNTGCPSTTTCLLGQEETGAMRGFTVCGGPVGTGTQGTSCVDQGDCAAGHLCTGGQCYKFCRVGTPSDCATSFTCDAATAITVGSTSYNICM